MVVDMRPKTLLPSLALDEHPGIAVEEAEKAFLRGEFRRALKDANRCLVYAKSIRRSNSEYDDDDCFRVNAPLHFPLSFEGTNLPLFICIDSKPSDLTDRAAAIALQSWYELSRKITDSRTAQDSHLTLLQPFWKAYSADDLHSRSCSLELVLVLVRFCQATHHVTEAFELAFATLDHLLSANDSSCEAFVRDQWYLVQELGTHLLCKMLPYCLDSTSVSSGLKRLSERDPTELVDKANWQLSDRFNESAANVVIRFLESPPVHWPEECQHMFETCQQRLEDDLTRHQESRQENFSAASRLSGPTDMVPVSGVREASGRFTLLPTLGWDGSLDQWLWRALYLARLCVVDPLIISEARWENRGKLTLLIWAFWIAWRQRGRLYKGTKLALRLFFQPLHEIVEALVPSKRHV